MGRTRSATVDDLYRVDQKAELVGGELVVMAATGGLPSFAGGEIFASLRSYARATKSGHAFTDNAGFIVNLPNRRSFSPDVAFASVPVLTRQFISGAPRFAVEVRSDGDYGPAAERTMAEKRGDYFAAGTVVVWDVDVLDEQLVRVYHASTPARRLCIAVAMSPRPNRRCPGGRCRLTICSRSDSCCQQRSTSARASDVPC
jgi:Uma2 family endonuclease